MVIMVMRGVIEVVVLQDVNLGLNRPLNLLFAIV